MRKRNISFATRTDSDKQDHIRLCTGMISCDCEKFMEDLYKLFEGKITTEIGFVYNPKFMEFTNKPEVIPDLKEKIRVD
jgi:hypothetical protein